jgi:regulator of nucleoside diphosphate kinase
MTTTMITDLDYKRLIWMLHMNVQHHPAEQFRLFDIYHGLHEADVVRAEEIPNDIVTMRSIISLVDSATGQKRRVQLAYPDETGAVADPAHDRVSILSPLGTAIIGNRVGCLVDFQDQDGPQHLLIESLEYQPEAAGHFDL